MSRRLYDERCYDLAEAFLIDEFPLNTPANRDELTGDIQALIEDFIFVKRRERDRDAPKGSA